MTAADRALRQVTMRLLLRQAGPDAEARGVAAATRRSFDELADILTPLIGKLGVDALVARAVHLTRREYPWLDDTGDAGRADGPIERISLSLANQEPALGIEAAGAVLATFTGLLVTLIGEPLTARLLRQAWPDDFPSDAGA
jgi:hypothetical protein